jgi:glycosyltransferase involved in cell wall biosynthesis
LNSRKKPKLVFVIPSLKGAGAERSVINVANNLDSTVFDTTILQFRSGEKLENLVSENVSIHSLETNRPRYSFFKLRSYIRENRVDIVVPSLPYTNAVTYFATRSARVGAKSVLREENNVAESGASNRSIGALVSGIAYRRANHIVAVSDGVRESCIDRYTIRPDKVTRIYPPVDVDGIAVQANTPDPNDQRKEKSGRKQIISVGRLVKQKGFDDLIRAFSKLEDADVDLTILGEGPDRAMLTKLAAELGVQDRISMPGWVPNPFTWMAKSDVFVLSSRWEGFGHVVVEAMASGVPVIATDCPSGPGEIIENNVSGILVESSNPSAITAALNRFFSDPELSTVLRKNANDRTTMFRSEHSSSMYSQLFSDLL